MSYGTPEEYAARVTQKAVDQFNADEKFSRLLKNFVELRTAALMVVRATGPEQTQRAIEGLRTLLQRKRR